MREILFRGKTYDGKWEQGDLRHGGYIHNDSETYIMRADVALQNIPVDPKTLGQYTGLVDKNGKKIFEGDLVRFVNPETGELSEEVQEVVWDDEQACLLLLLRETGYKEEFDGVPHWYVVVGNIHDNPELLKGE